MTNSTAAELAERILKDIRCPVHGQRDCSPLLNGCSLVNQIYDDVAALVAMCEQQERRCVLRVEKLFESGLRIPEGTPIYVEETEVGAIGHWYPDPFKLSSHSFALADDEYTVLIPARH